MISAAARAGNSAGSTSSSPVRISRVCCPKFGAGARMQGPESVQRQTQPCTIQLAWSGSLIGS